MAGAAVIAYFDGDPDELARGFCTTASRYAETTEAPQPIAALLLRNRNGIAVVLAWPEGSSLAPFRAFLKEAIGETGLPHPRTEHFRAGAIAWNEIGARSA